MNRSSLLAVPGVVLALALSACSTGDDNGTGGSSTGGMPSGGSPGGGARSGGTATGSVSSGGASAGGTSSGGVGAGGAPSGGVSSGGTPSGGTSSGGASTGGAASGGAASGGAASGGGSSGGAAGAGGSGPGGIDLTGTWISEVKTSGQLTVPIVGMTNADIDLVIRLSLTKASGMLNGVFDICRLTTTTTPDPTSLVVTFSPAVIATLTANTTETDFAAMVGAAVPFPDITVLSGMDSSGMQLDADMDSNPGVTVPSNIGGLIMLNAYTGLTIKISMMATLEDEKTITGTTSFSTNGTVFGSDNTLLTMGTISVVPTSMAIPITVTKLPGDVKCDDVVMKFPVTTSM